MPALDTSLKFENTTLSLKLFQHPGWKHPSIYKKFQILLSLFPPKSLFYLSLTDDAGTPANRTLSPVANDPQFVGKLQVFRYSLILSILRCLTLSLTSPLSSHKFYSTVGFSEETNFSPRRKTPKPNSIYSLSPSLFLLPHQLTALPPIVTCRGKLGVSQSEFRIRVWVERPSQGLNSLAYPEELL